MSVIDSHINCIVKGDVDVYIPVYFCVLYEIMYYVIWYHNLHIDAAVCL